LTTGTDPVTVHLQTISELGTKYRVQDAFSAGKTHFYFFWGGGPN